MLPVDSSLSLWPPTLPCSLPHTSYRFTVAFEIPEDEPSNPPAGESPAAIVELRVRQWYTLFVEPISGYRVTMDEDYTVSPELTLRFKIPLFLLNVGPYSLHLLQAYISQQLASLPIDAGLGEFLKPHIQNYAVSLAQETGMRKVFKVIFSVVVVKIDLVDKDECDRIRSRGR